MFGQDNGYQKFFMIQEHLNSLPIAMLVCTPNVLLSMRSECSSPQPISRRQLINAILRQASFFLIELRHEPFVLSLRCWSLKRFFKEYQGFNPMHWLQPDLLLAFDRYGTGLGKLQIEENREVLLPQTGEFDGSLCWSAPDDSPKETLRKRPRSECLPRSVLSR